MLERYFAVEIAADPDTLHAIFEDLIVFEHVPIKDSGDDKKDIPFILYLLRYCENIFY